MNSFFHYDGFLMRILTGAMYLISLNLLFLICCIPVITIGASCTAMHSVMMAYLQGDEPDILKSFFRAFADNFKISTFIWCGMLLTAVSIVGNLRFSYLYNLGKFSLLTVIFNFIIFLLVMLWIYVFPSIAYFENTVRGHLRFSMMFSFGKLPVSFGIFAVHAGIILPGLFLAQYFFAATLLFLLCGFSLPVFLTDRWLIRWFAPFGEKHNETDEEMVS